MAKKADNAKAQDEKMRGAIALALISAPTPYAWWERTMSIDTLVEEVRNLLDLPKNLAKRILKVLKKAIAEWSPVGWLSYNEKKNCVSINKTAEPMLSNIAEAAC